MHRYSRLLKILKIAVGSMLAMAAAQALGLRYSSSAGVITLLSIQDTKRETIRVTGRRFLAFLAAMVLGPVSFALAGYRPLAMMILHPKHVSDLLLEDIKLFKDLTNIKDGEPFRFAGFGCFSFAHTPHYRENESKLGKVPFSTTLEETDRLSSVAFYAKEVMKADGEIYMYSTEDDPKERATIVGFDKRFVALPIRGKGIGAIVSAVTE